ncbi:MAG: cation-transporting P-type ATPase [Candidatus Micrarchaeota archaeon]|nr:cation-transporting P-type ATPase [Candidatus Micrarchaeota archaeon]
MKGKNSVGLALEHLGTSQDFGLSENEASKRLAKYGKNEIAAQSNFSTAGSLLSFLKEPMIWLLAGAALAYFLLGETLESYVMAIAIIPIALIDIWLDYRSGSALDKLRQRAVSKTRVLRDGIWREIPSSELVPGDIIAVRQGDIIPADGPIISCSNFKVNESSLTGESMPVAKTYEDNFSREVFGNQGYCFAGTAALSGKAICLCERTGKETEYGKIGGMLSGIVETQTPIQKDMGRIIGILGIFAILISMALFAINIAVAGASWEHALIDSISLAIAAIPEEFPVVFALFLSIGALSLVSHNALVKRMTAVETLGSIDTLCTDKTGTLTEGKMALCCAWSGGKEIPIGRITGSSSIMQDATLASEIDPEDEMERAIRAAFPEYREMHHEWALKKEYPFDEAKKYMTHAWKKGNGYRICAKGSVEGILEICKGADKEGIEKANMKMAMRGIRVLAVASSNIRQISGDRKKDEKGMEFVGLLGFSDPIRKGVKEAVLECAKAGIRVIMMTGDHSATAEAVAKQIGMEHPVIVEGKNFNKAMAAHANVFSRVVPRQKLDLVELLQSEGRVVAVTGDGINDAPALKRANIGIAMGLKGTEVSREAAGIVLLDDNFVTIVEAIRQGREIYSKIRNAFSYLIAFHMPIILSALIIPMIGMPLLLMPIHIVLLELVLHPAISLAFIGGKTEKDVMKDPPRARSENIIQAKDIRKSVLLGIFLFAICLYSYSYWMIEGEEYARAVAFSTMLFGELFLMAEYLSGKEIMSFRIAKNRWFIVIFLASACAWIMVACSGIANKVLEISSINASSLMMCIIVSSLPMLMAEAWKALLQKKK